MQCIVNDIIEICAQQKERHVHGLRSVSEPIRNAMVNCLRVIIHYCDYCHNKVHLKRFELNEEEKSYSDKSVTGKE